MPTTKRSENIKAQPSGGRTALTSFVAEYPQLFAGINLDADVYLSPFVRGSWHDFNPDTLRQFRDWLAGAGLYADGAMLSNYRSHRLQLEEVNAIAAQEFGSWDDVEPPRYPKSLLPGESKPWMLLWEQFRRHLVDLHYDDLSRWLVEAGISSSKIYSSQGFMAPRQWACPSRKR